MRFRLFVPLFVAATFLPAVTACEGAEGEGEGEEGEGEEAELDELVDAFVKFIDECKPFGEVEKYEPILAANVTGSFQRASVEASLQRSLDNPALTLNKQEVAACIAEFDSCAPSVFGGSDSACNRIFAGNRADGEGCASNQECVDGLVCSSNNGETCGTCGTPPGDGESCDTDPDPDGLDFGDCAEGLVCVGDDNGGAVCQAALAIGDTCDPFSDRCGDDAFCDDEQQPAVCAGFGQPDERPAAGDACTEDEGCGNINTGLSCVDDVCVEMGVAQPGQACEPSQSDPAVWCINQLAGVNICVPSEANPAEGVCTALNGVGGACVNGRCADDAVCNDADECVALPGVGDDCIDFACAEGLLCNEDVDPAVCAEPPADGEPCLGFQCAEDSTCNADEVCEALPALGEACPDDECAGDLECRDGTCAEFEDNLVCAE